MTKVTEQDVVRFLREKVARIAKELETAQSALNALQETVVPLAAQPKVSKPGAPAAKTARKKAKAKSSGSKRGRKPAAEKYPVETIRVADQLG